MFNHLRILCSVNFVSYIMIKRYFVKIMQYCGIQNYVRVFLSGGVPLSLSDD